MRTRCTLSAAEYQALPCVALRIREGCGLTAGASSGCVYLASMGSADGPRVTWGRVPLHRPDELDSLLRTGCDVTRSAWDKRDLLVYVDLDYLDPELRGEPYLHPADAFLALEPAYLALRGTLDEFGMPLLDLMTGAGYAFLGRVGLHGSAATRLAALSPECPPWHLTHGRRRPAWCRTWIHVRHARSYHGLGLVLEHLAHRVVRTAATSSGLPVVVDNTEVGTGPAGRACASLDFTHLADPLDSRHLRVPFAAYQKHRLRPDIVGAAAARLPPVAVVPRRRRPLLDALAHGRDLEHAAEDAVTADGRIPFVDAGLDRLARDYERAPLSVFHREFATRLPDEDADDPQAALDLRALPACVRACLEQPNDLLLKPAHLQNLVRVLMARGWAPRRIARLVLANYRTPGLWPDSWRRADPATRAFCEVRMFAGMIATGLDRGEDLNCVSTQEKGMCPGVACTSDLRRERDRLLERWAT